MTPQELLLTYYISVNFFTFILFGIDKSMASIGSWRTPEKVLWFFALIGGSIGGFSAMLFFRHKTQKIEFQLIMLLIAAFQMGSYIAVYTYVL